MKEAIEKRNVSHNILREVRQAVRLKAKSLGDQSKQIYAQEFIRTIFETFIGNYKHTYSVADELTETIGDKIKHLPFDLAVYTISTSYTTLLPSNYRSRLGIFYTPPVLVKRILDVIEDKIDGSLMEQKIIDPSCGGGAFLVPILHRILRNHNLDHDEIQYFLTYNLRGIDKDPFGAWLTEQFLEYLLGMYFPEHTFNLEGIIACQDSLGIDAKQFETFDLVIGNPPYGKVSLSDSVRKKWKKSIYGHANYYGLFSHLGTKLLKEDGIMAYVMPASFLGGKYFKNLRYLFLNTCPPLAADFVKQRDGVFPDVLQEVSLMYFKKNAVPRPDIDVNFIDACKLEELQITPGGTYLISSTDDAPWIIPRNIDQLAALVGLDRLTLRLKDLGYKVSTGPLVWNRHKDQLSKRKGRHSTLIVWAESISPKNNGVFKHRCEGRNHLPYYTSIKSNDPNLVHQPCILIQRTTSIEQERRLVLGIMDRDFLAKYPKGVAVENHLNMVIPIKGRTPLVRLTTIAYLLNTKIIDNVFRCINGSTAVSSFELSSIPFPDLNSMIALDHLIKAEQFAKANQLIERLYL
ncbi:MAG: N-6 DNA methylase [Bacteroidota bacterium]